MNTDSAGGSPPAGASGSQFAPPPALGGVPPPGKIEFDTPPPPNATVQTLVPPSTSRVEDAIAAESDTSSSPAAAGADGAEAKAVALIEDLEAKLEELFDHANDKVNSMVSTFESKLSAGHAEIDAITNELKNGGIVARLNGLEMAVASHAAPAISHIAHDSLDLLHTWFEHIKPHFERVVAGVAQDRADAAKAAAEAKAAAGT